MRKLVRASLLILALSCTAYAGDMPTPRPEGEMPTPVQPQPTPTSNKESITIDAQDTTESTVTEAILDLISTVLALF